LLTYLNKIVIINSGILYELFRKMKIVFLGDSLTAGNPGAAYFERLHLKLPEHKLLNYGKGGDTVKSLFQRIRKTEFEPPIDITLLWIGVNDFLVKKSLFAPLRKIIRRQPWSKNQQEFNFYYRLLLDLIASQSRQIITIPPLFIGEELDNPWNRKLAAAAAEIKNIAADYPAAIYLDLRESFRTLLADRKPVQQGYFTIDGVHFNEKGADIAADIFFQTLSKQIKGGRSATII